jgi:hypothetical protein
VSATRTPAEAVDTSGRPCHLIDNYRGVSAYPVGRWRRERHRGRCPRSRGEASPPGSRVSHWQGCLDGCMQRHGERSAQARKPPCSSTSECTLNGSPHPSLSATAARPILELPWPSRRLLAPFDRAPRSASRPAAGLVLGSGRASCLRCRRRPRRHEIGYVVTNERLDAIRRAARLKRAWVEDWRTAVTDDRVAQIRSISAGTCLRLTSPAMARPRSLGG